MSTEEDKIEEVREALPATEEIPPSGGMGRPEIPELLAPGIERLGAPTFAARTVPDPVTGAHPSPLFLAVVSIGSLVADVGSKLWAEKRLETYPQIVTIWENHLSLVLARNKGGAWGLLQGTNENVRRPFFLLVSAAAIAFIVTLYRRLTPRQHALKWGLPLVLGGALGNVFDRVRYGHVIDFIDFRADAIRSLNEVVAKYVQNHVVTDHWPTFNVADIAICVGVLLMAVDMFTSKRGPKHAPLVSPLPATELAGAGPAGEDLAAAVDAEIAAAARLAAEKAAEAPPAAPPSAAPDDPWKSLTRDKP